jgi:hypothetical protein
MEDLFSNPHSDIPDALWKSASPMERQLAAVEYWAELRGVEKTAAKASVRDRIVDFLAKDSTPALLAASTVGGLAAGHSLYSLGKKPQAEEVRVGPNSTTKTPTREQIDLRIARRELDERERLGDPPSKARRFLQDKREELAELRANNPMTATAANALMGGLAGYYASKRLRS